MFKDTTVTVSVISATIAVITFIISYYQIRKSFYINVIANERLRWAENLRSAIFEFISAFYNQKDLQIYKAKILLYLNPENENHRPVIDAIEKICIKEDGDPNELIKNTQILMRWNWWMVKTETGITLKEEARRDYMTKKRRISHYGISRNNNEHL